MREGGTELSDGEKKSCFHAFSVAIAAKDGVLTPSGGLANELLCGFSCAALLAMLRDSKLLKATETLCHRR